MTYLGLEPRAPFERGSVGGADLVGATRPIR
jgi:hypothetical protein